MDTFFWRIGFAISTRDVAAARRSIRSRWLTFTGTTAVDFASLADGWYTLTIFADKVGNTNGPLDGNGYGIGGDDYVLVGNPTNQ